jgi:hypothetical protein
VKDEALARVANIEDPGRKLNMLREYLQAWVLRSLHEQEAFRSVAFVGGTALRFLERLPRFSEDLDFSVVDASGYSPVRWLRKLQAEMSLAGYECSIRWNDRKTVNVAWLRFAGLMQDAGIAARSEQKLPIKLEIDTRPPAGASLVRTVVSGHLTFVVCHHDLPSMMAGKLHAVHSRSYPKGRDWFDLLWYRGRRPPVEPNLVFLQNALDQTQGVNRYDARRWRDHVKERLDGLDVDLLRRDVFPFLERPEDRVLLSIENLTSVLGP